TISDTTSAVSITSNDTVTTWLFVWIEIIATGTITQNGTTQITLTEIICEAQFFNPPGSGVATGITVEILGPALLYTTPIRTWRLGLYSNTTGWPTCGT